MRKKIIGLFILTLGVKMKLIKHLVILLSLFTTEFFFAQTKATDVIITKKGEHISCTITHIDTAKVYFKVGGSVSSIEVNIPLVEVQDIQYAPKQIPALAQPTSQVQSDDYVPANTATVDTKAIKTFPPQKANCLTFFGGLAYPVGKFSSTELDTNEIGPANAGQLGKIHFTHRTKKDGVVGLSCFYSVNPLNTSPITDKYKYNTDSVWTADKAQWRAFGVQLSVGYHKMINNDISFYGNILAGYISLKYPEVTLRVSSFQYLKFNTVTADALSFGGEIGMNYRLFESLGAVINLAYVQSNCKFNEVLIQGESPLTNSKKVSQTIRNVKQSYQNVFVSLGVNYWF